MSGELESSPYVLTISEDDADEGRAISLLSADVLRGNPSGLGVQRIEGAENEVAWYRLDVGQVGLADVTGFIEHYDWIHPVEVLLRAKAMSGGADRFFSFDDVDGSWGWLPQS